jgi:AcrR family transcriptional regulator
MTRGRDVNRRALLESAVAEIHRHGEQGARVDRIAAAAGLNKRLIYHYFGDKTGLVDAVLTEHLACLDAVSLSAATKRLLLCIQARPAQSLDGVVNGPDRLSAAAAMVLGRLAQTEPVPRDFTGQQWASACVELISLVVPDAAVAAFGAQPGSAEFRRRCESLLTRTKPRIRLRPDVR